MTAETRPSPQTTQSPVIRLFLHHSASAGVALFYGWFCYTKAFLPLRDFAANAGGIAPLISRASANQLMLSVLLSVLFLFFRNSLLTIFFLSRKVSKETSVNPLHWAAAVGGTFVGFLFISNPGFPGPRMTVANWIMALGGLVAVAAVASLGRSFGIVPSNRGVRTGGLYRLVRHPIYGVYMIMDVGFLLGNPCLRNILVFVAFLVLTVYRAVFEEKLLARDPEYRSYMDSVTFRFIPGVW